MRARGKHGGQRSLREREKEWEIDESENRCFGRKHNRGCAGGIPFERDPAMTHEEVKKAGTAAIYLQGGLSEKEREEFEEHLFGCPECSGIVQAGLILKTRGELG